jgi:GTP-binding protein HflX
MTYRGDNRTIQDDEVGFLVGAELYQPNPPISIEDSLDELELLADTAGVKVSGRATQRLKQIDPATFIGSGKVQEIHTELLNLGANVVIFDDELSPRHQRELEKVFGESVKVLDRSVLILDIFAQHANTKEGALQVELAQLEYRLPRLTRQWTHLARQSGGGGSRSGNGGVGLRGPGETQLEVDRREIGRKISKLKEDIEQVRAHRGRHRAQRSRLGVPVIALVGYTNAGKSTLLNALTGSTVYAADQLFATLDPTTRKLALPGGKSALISDTVGFIQKLPTTLIAAFRATLEEVAEADILLHVVDASHPNADYQIEAVEDTLAQIEVPKIPRLLVLNKLDQVDEMPTFRTAENYDSVVPVSALKGTGLKQLLSEIERIMIENMVEIKVTLPYKRLDLLNQIRENGVIDEEEPLEQGVKVRAHVPQRMAARFHNDDDDE